MAKITPYQQRYQVGSRRGTSAEFGGIAAEADMQRGKSIENLGNTLMDIEYRRQSRESTIERVRAINEFSRLADEEFTRMQTEDDLTDTEAPKRYNQFIAQKRDELIANHKGSAESKAELSARLEQYYGQYSGSMYKQSTAAQFKVMDEFMVKNIRSLSDAAGDNPASLQEQFNSLDGYLADFGPGLSAEQERQYREIGRSQIIQSTVNSYMNEGNYDAADAILSTEGVNEVLTPETQRAFKNKIIAGQRETEKGALKAQEKLREAEYILGRTLTPEERQKLAGVSKTQGQSFSEKVVELQQGLGRELTEAELTKLGGISTGDGTVGGLSGHSQKFVRDNINSWAAGTLAPDAESEFQQSLQNEYGPVMQKDPVTGTYYEVPRPIPPFIQEAMRQRGFSFDKQQLTTVQSQELPGTEKGGVPPMDERDNTLWDEAAFIAGPIAKGGQFVSEHDPFNLFPETARFRQAKTRATGIQRQLTTALQNNTKYPEGERKAIEQSVNVLSSVWDNPQSYRQQLIAVDEELEARQRFAENMANDRTQPVDVRKSAAAIRNQVQNVRMSLGIPVRVKSRDEALKLPPGTQFIDPQGKIRTVPNQPVSDTNATE